MDDIIVRELTMPLTIKAFTTLDSEGNYNIFVNMDLSDEAKLKALSHEETHAREGDFFTCATKLAELKRW